MVNKDTKPSKCTKCGKTVNVSKFASHSNTLCASHKDGAETKSTAMSVPARAAVSNEAPVVLSSIDEVTIRANARDLPISIIKLRDKIKTLTVKAGSVVATALDQAHLDMDGASASDMDIRVNGQRASLLQVLRENDTIYIATKVSGA